MGENPSLEEYLNEKVFVDQAIKTVDPDAKDVKGFEQFMDRYRKGLMIERAAVDNLK